MQYINADVNYFLLKKITCLFINWPLSFHYRYKFFLAIVSNSSSDRLNNRWRNNIFLRLNKLDLLLTTKVPKIDTFEQYTSMNTTLSNIAMQY